MNMAQMRLFVLGPAFDLPSIDAECIAAAALLKSQLGGDPSRWTITASHDLSSTLPYLIDNNTTVYGFRGIASHVLAHSAASPPRLDATQRADSSALSSFLTSHAPALLATYLYVSSANYSATTRPALTRILPLHSRYIVPPSIRSAARRKTEHLGLGGLDIDTVHDAPDQPAQKFDGAESSFEADTRNRASLLLPRKDTVRSLLARQPETTAVFKLQRLADSFFGPLGDILGENERLLGTEGPTEVDCLAYGYLSLMLCASVPRDWLAKRMRQTYKQLVAYVERLHAEFGLETKAEAFGALDRCKTSVEEAETRKRYGMELPWTAPRQVNLWDVGSALGGALRDQLPMFKLPVVQRERRDQDTVWLRYLPALVLTAFGTLLGGGYLAFRSGLLVWPHGEEVHVFGRKRLSDYGHVGAALAGLNVLGQQASRDMAFHRQEEQLNRPPLEVGVEVQAEPTA